MPMKSSYKRLSVPEKANKLLSGVLIVLTIIAIRIWHLAVVEHDDKLEEAYKPQKRTIPELVERATISDRFDIPLAENRIQYDVSVAYSAIRELPSRAWHTDASGSKRLVYSRKSYISSLAELLSRELHIDKEELEDVIHAKASVLGTIPYLVQADVPERTYLRLNMLAKDWPGLHVEAKVRRYYPKGRTAADLLGYVGPISAQEYQRITEELGRLRECIRAYEDGENPQFPKGLGSIDQVRSLLNRLENNAYHINALVGKLGVEAYCDGLLRGQIGKKMVLVDRRGNFIQELDNTVPAVCGSKLQLTISAELQAFADSLLLEHERVEQMRSAKSIRGQTLLPPLFPWIKGGAIVVMDPKNGQILAMASSPRYQSNDFVARLSSKSSVFRWLETPEFVGEIYDRKTSLKRERRNASGEYYDEEIALTFDAYLDFILPSGSEIRSILQESTVADALEIQLYMERLLACFSCEEPLACSAIFDAIYPKETGHIPTGEIASIKQQEIIAQCCQKPELVEIQEALRPFFSGLAANYDKILLIDLFRLVIDPARIHPEILTEISQCTLRDFIECQGHYIALRSAFSPVVEDLFMEIDFKQWKQENFSQFLEAKRREEKARNQRCPTPYIDYLNEEKKRQYQEFSKHYLDSCLAYLIKDEVVQLNLLPYYESLAVWKQELASGAHRALSWYTHYAYLKTRFATEPYRLLPVLLGFRAFSELQRPLLGRYPLMITRNFPQKEQDLASAFYPTYGFGCLRSHAFSQAATLGSIFKLVSAYSVLVQKVDLEIEDLSKLFVMVDRKSYGLLSNKPHVGFFKDGTPIPTFFKGGSVPGNDFSGRGDVDLVSALEMSSNPYFSLLIGEHLEDPEDICHAASLFGFGEKTGVCLPGEYPGRLPHDVAYNRSGLYATAIGQHTLVVTPLQTAVMVSALVNGGIVYVPSLLLGEWREGEFLAYPPVKKRDIFMPKVIPDLIKLGMHNVIWGKYGTTRAVQNQFSPSLLTRIIGKTSTAEAITRVGLDRQYGNMKLKHVWFAAVGFQDPQLEIPEIVVIVYLRFGEFGRDAAPMAIRMIEKWESIQKKYCS